MLAEYGDNVDAAIKRLTDLRLSGAAAAAAAPPEQQAAVAAAAVEQQQAQAQQQKQQQAQQQQDAAQGGAADAGPSGAANGHPQSADEWVDLVVREMAAATDMADARARASKVLQAFEQVAVQHAKSQVGAVVPLPLPRGGGWGLRLAGCPPDAS